MTTSAELAEGGGTRLHGAAALEQEQAQSLASTIPARKAQAFAGDQFAHGRSSVDEIILAVPSLLATRALALVHRDIGSPEEANEPGAVTARTLDREGRHAELPRRGAQPSITSGGRRDLLAVELPADCVEGNRDVHVLVRVDAYCRRPLHDLASFSSRWSTGLDRAVSGKDAGFYQVTGQSSEAVGGRQGGFKARPSPASMVMGHLRRRPALSAAHRTDRYQATLDKRLAASEDRSLGSTFRMVDLLLVAFEGKKALLNPLGNRAGQTPASPRGGAGQALARHGLAAGSGSLGAKPELRCAKVRHCAGVS